MKLDDFLLKRSYFSILNVLQLCITSKENNFLPKNRRFSLLRNNASVIMSGSGTCLQYFYASASLFYTLAQNNLHQNTTPSPFVQQKVHWLSAKRCLWKRGLND